MRFMLLLKGDPRPDPEAGPGSGPVMPPAELIGAMLKYNEELVRAGVLLAAEGLLDSSTGSRVVYRAGKRTVIDGPFAEAKELVAGFYLIQVKSKEEAIEWAKRCPVDRFVRDDEEAVVEVRQVGESDEIPTMTEEQREADRRVREQIPGL